MPPISYLSLAEAGRDVSLQEISSILALRRLQGRCGARFRVLAPIMPRSIFHLPATCDGAVFLGLSTLPPTCLACHDDNSSHPVATRATISWREATYAGSCCIACSPLLNWLIGTTGVKFQWRERGGCRRVTAAMLYKRGYRMDLVQGAHSRLGIHLLDLHRVRYIPRLFAIISDGRMHARRS